MSYLYYYEQVSVVDDKIIYYKFSTDSTKVGLSNQISLIKNFEDTTINKDKPISNEKLIGLSLLIRKTYGSLERRSDEHKTLDVATITCTKHLDIDINFSRAILLEDESIIVFNDYSESQKGYLESIIKKGSLL